MRVSIVVLVCAGFSACLAPTAAEPDAGAPEPDAGSADLDAGPRQCTADGGTCWAPETVCEVGICTYQFPDAGGLCGTTPIRPSCFCSFDSSGYHPLCTGGCPPEDDGGFKRVCLKPNCGQVSCSSGTTCVGYSHCE